MEKLVSTMHHATLYTTMYHVTLYSTVYHERQIFMYAFFLSREVNYFNTII